jgi:ABC-type transport system involved in multi-copper enzyme maturation permease subunit
MTAPDVLVSIRHLARDTFRQSIASGICWLMLIASAVCILVCLSVRITTEKQFFEGPEPSLTTEEMAEMSGSMTIGFGSIHIPRTPRDRTDAVRFIQLTLAAGVADSTGLLLVLLWTSGFLPSFLEPSAVSVLLAKPTPRWSLLTGKYLGVIAFVAVQACIFVLGTWAALGLVTGVWDATYLLCIPILVLHFAAFYSFSALLAVYVRNAVTCMFGSVIFWVICLGINWGRHAAAVRAEFQSLSPVFRFLIETSYWLLPKPADFSIMLYDALRAEKAFGTLPLVDAIQKAHVLYLDLSIISSLAFAVVVLGLAIYQFVYTDY